MASTTSPHGSAIESGELGPVQLLVVGFERTDQFSGEILDELAAQEARGIIRILDLLYVEKTDEDELVIVEIADLSEKEASEFGGVVSKFLGFEDAGPAAVEAIDAEVGGNTYGLAADDIADALSSIPVGTAAGILLFEHVWATHFRDAVRRAGGFPVMQGFLTQEAVLMVGEELRAIREAAVAVEFASIVEGAALLEATEAILAAELVREAAAEVAIEAIEESEAIEAAAAARAVRALIAAGLIEQYAAAEALEALVVAGLLEAEVLSEAEVSAAS